MGGGKIKRRKKACLTGPQLADKIVKVLRDGGYPCHKRPTSVVVAWNRDGTVRVWAMGCDD